MQLAAGDATGGFGVATGFACFERLTRSVSSCAACAAGRNGSSVISAAKSEVGKMVLVTVSKFSAFNSSVRGSFFEGISATHG